MDKYDVLISFTDNVDGGVYYEGDTYPRNGVAPSAERVQSLLGSKNPRGKPLIAKQPGMPSAAAQAKKPPKAAPKEDGAHALPGQGSVRKPGAQPRTRG